MSADHSAIPCHALLLTAHCDDAELWAGGTLARWAEEGRRCVVGVAFHDDTRRAETLRSSAILQYHPRFKPLDQAMRAWVLDLLMEARPEVLLTHGETDPHFEHQIVHRSTIEALTKFPHRREGPQRWYAFDSYYQTRAPGVWPMAVDISQAIELKLMALDQHQSQNPEELCDMARQSAAMVGLRIRAAFAEAFYPFDLLGRWPMLRCMP